MYTVQDGSRDHGKCHQCAGLAFPPLDQWKGLSSSFVRQQVERIERESPGNAPLPTRPPLSETPKVVFAAWDKDANTVLHVFSLAPRLRGGGAATTPVPWIGFVVGDEREGLKGLHSSLLIEYNSLGSNTVQTHDPKVFVELPTVVKDGRPGPRGQSARAITFRIFTTAVPVNDLGERADEREAALHRQYTTNHTFASHNPEGPIICR